MKSSDPAVSQATPQVVKQSLTTEMTARDLHRATVRLADVVQCASPTGWVQWFWNRRGNGFDFQPNVRLYGIGVGLRFFGLALCDRPARFFAR